MLVKILKNEKLRERVFYYTIFLVLLSIPLDYAFGSVAITVFVVLNLFFGFAHKKVLTPVFFFLISIYVLGVFSYAWSAFPDLTLKALGRELSLLLVPLGLFFSPQLSKGKLFKLWRMFGVYLVGVFICLLGVAFYKMNFFGLHDFFFYHDLVSPFFMNAIYMSFLVAINILIVGFNTKKIISFDSLLVLILSAFLFLLSSKLVLVLTFLGFVIQLLYKRINVRLLAVMIVFFVSVLVFVKPIQERFVKESNANYTEVLTSEKFTNIYPWNGTTIRLLQARIGVEILTQEKSWIQGIGLGASQPFIAENQAKKEMYHSYGEYNFHNQYVQILVELGVIGLLLYLILIFCVVYDFRQNIMVLSIILLIFGLGFTESFLWRQRGVFIFLMVLTSIYKFNIRKDNYETERQ